MKTVICLLASAIALCGTVFAQNKEKTPNQNTPNQNKNKILIAYFSWGGNTRSMAKQIQEQTGGDLFEIVAVKPYPKNYDECVSLAKKEQQNNTRPQFSGEVKNIADYDVIFVGYPNWWGSMPMVLFTFLEKYDLKDKTVVPFCTHGGGRWGRSVDDLKKLCPKAKFKEGLAISGDWANRSKNDITKWIQKTGYSKPK